MYSTSTAVVRLLPVPTFVPAILVPVRTSVGDVLFAFHACRQRAALLTILLRREGILSVVTFSRAGRRLCRFRAAFQLLYRIGNASCEWAFWRKDRLYFYRPLRRYFQVNISDEMLGKRSEFAP